MKLTLKRIGLICFVLFFFILSACQAQFGTTGPTLSPRATNHNPTRTLAPTSTPRPTSPATATPTVRPTNAITPSGPASCKVVPVLPPVAAEIDQLIPGAVEKDWSYGPADATIVIIEYTDFQCQVCATLAMNLRALQIQYPDDVKVVFRYLPLTQEHDKAALAAQAAEAAGLQNKYWEMHDLLFTKQDEWMPFSVKEFSAWLSDQARGLKIDRQKFMEDLTSDAVVTKVLADTRESAKTSLTVPPALFFSKRQYQNWVDLSSLTSMVELFKLSERAFTSCPVTTIDPEKRYKATLKTEKGDIVLELYPKEAPMAVNSFVFLANQKWFDNSTFFRVVPYYLAEAGDPTGSGFGNPGYEFGDEVTPLHRFDQPGMLAMAHSNFGGANRSIFFITTTAIPEFDGKNTIFGKVIKGLDVVESLRPRDPVYDQVLLPADTLISVTIEVQ